METDRDRDTTDSHVSEYFEDWRFQDLKIMKISYISDSKWSKNSKNCRYRETLDRDYRNCKDFEDRASKN